MFSTLRVLGLRKLRLLAHVCGVKNLNGDTMKKILTTLSILALTACASVGKGKLESKDGAMKIESGSEICFIYPKDAKFEGQTQRDSGAKVGKTILKAVPKNYNITSKVSMSECDQPYTLVSEILEYENRASGWSGKPDKIKVKVSLSNRTKEEASSFTFYSETNTNVSAFFEWGNSAPYKLLDADFAEQVASLFGE